ncbi:MAG: helix-turn-helix domain-containing protein [Cytophagales bacterium]|nr:helix-turn-helix domain-containing protein [Cytophagales bacterium]
MKHVSILVPLGHSSLVNIEGTYQLFSAVNELLEGQGRERLFDLHLVGLQAETHQSSGLFTVNPDRLVHQVAHTDLVIIPALFGDQHLNKERNAPFLPWIVEQYHTGAEVVSYCIGAFFLAETGLLLGKQCSTHWRHVEELRRLYPGVQVLDDRIMTEDNGIYTSGGAYSALNLQLYLVEKFAGRDIAVLISKLFMIDIDRVSQSPFIIFEGQKGHGDRPIQKAQEYIENHYAEKISVDGLADMLALSRRNLERRFKKATHNTVAEYIQRVKMEAAKKNLESGQQNVAEVMYDVGYNDTKAFRDVFRKITGMTPLAYRNKYIRHRGLAEQE